MQRGGAHRRRYGPKKRTRKELRASAVLFLTGARSLDGVTAQWLARQYGLKLEDAEHMLAEALLRRAGRD